MYQPTHARSLPGKATAAALAAALLLLAAPAGAVAASWTDSTRPKASWTDSKRPKASWTDRAPRPVQTAGTARARL